MSGKAIDLTGQRFSRLVVIERAGSGSGRQALWRCLCECGTESVVDGVSLRSGHTKSCGCLQCEQFWTANFVHGMSGTREYQTWQSMKNRCYNKNLRNYEHYGGRGITVCARWRNSFENFYSDMGDKPHGRSIDRIDNDGNYEPGNCRWATPKQQTANRRPFKKQKATV